MNIESKLTNYTWIEISVFESNSKIKYDIDSIKEAEEFKDELTQVINDIDTYIEKMQKRNIKH